MDGRDMWLLKYSPSHFQTEMVLEALCTHRPSLLPIEWLSEALGLAQRGRQRPLRAGNLVKLGHLEEVKVVTRFPWGFGPRAFDPSTGTLAETLAGHLNVVICDSK